VLRILTWLVGAAVASGIFGCAMLVKCEIKRPFWWRCVKVCCGFILERRGVCRWKGRVHCNGRRYVARETEEKLRESPFWPRKTEKRV